VLLDGGGITLNVEDDIRGKKESYEVKCVN